MSNLALLKFVGGLLLYELIFMVIWGIVDAPIIRIELDNFYEDRYYRTCAWDLLVFPTLSIFSKIGLLLWGCVLSYQTRTVAALWRESTYVGVAIYNSGLIITITIILLIVLSGFHLISFIVACIGVFLLFGGSIFIIFFRILYHIIQNPNAKNITDETSSDINIASQMPSGRNIG